MKQEVTNFGDFYRLRLLMPGDQDLDELKEELVWKFTNFRTNSLREMKQTEYDQMIEYMEDQIGDGVAERKRPGYYDKNTELWRRRTMKIIFVFFEKIKKPKSIKYVKGIICRACKTKDINRIPAAQLCRIYNDWLERVKVREITDEIVKEELVKAGYLEKGDEL